jgi:hypothetical protein
VLVVSNLGMIQVGTLDVGGGALGDGAQFLDRGFSATALKTLVPLAQGFGDGAGQDSPVSRAIAWASLWASGSLTFRLRVFLSFCDHCLPFFTSARFPDFPKKIPSE